MITTILMHPTVGRMSLPESTTLFEQLSHQPDCHLVNRYSEKTLLAWTKFKRTNFYDNNNPTPPSAA